MLKGRRLPPDLTENENGLHQVASKQDKAASRFTCHE
jgi:hypothetical protein